MRCSFLIVAAMAWMCSVAAPLDPPSMHCASVNVAGDVTVTWTPPADPGGDFVSYEIWHATDITGPFNLLSTVMVYGQVNYVHVGANANAGAQFYYMVTTSTGAPPEVSVPSDTLATLFLQVFQSTPLGSASLSWNSPSPSTTAASDFTKIGRAHV